MQKMVNKKILLTTCYIDFINFMKSPFSQKFDSDHIRQGLISIRNTQLQLLNQLKHQTQILKHYSPPSTTSQLSQRASNQKKVDRFSSYTIEGKTLSLDNESKIPQQSSQLGSWNENELRDEIKYLRNQNKLANSNYQKLKKNMDINKQRVGEMQSSLNFLSKFYYDILLQILQDKSISEVRQFITLQSSKNLWRHGPIKSFIDDILMLIDQIQKKRREAGKAKENVQSEKDITNQLIDLKSQLSILINQANKPQTIQQKQSIPKNVQELQEKNLKIDELQMTVQKLENQNRQIARYWDKELSERKKTMAQLQSLRKQASKWQQKQKKIIFYAKDMENKATKLQKTLKDKQKTEAILKQNCNKLAQTLNLVRESNQSLRLEVKSLQENKEKKYISLSQQKKQLENELKMLSLQQQKLIQVKDAEIQSLHNHLAELKKNQQSLRQFGRRNNDNQLMQQEIYWKKVNIMRTNKTIDHLWQVKEVQYENIIELLKRMKK